MCQQDIFPLAKFFLPTYNPTMRTWTQLIDEWGGSAKFAHDLGIPHGTAAAMKHRNAVHSRYWADIVARAKWAGLDGVTFELLASLQVGHGTDGKPSRGRFRRSTPAQAAVS